MPEEVTDADAAELYDLLNPWDGDRWPADRFYAELVTAATDVLDVGCGTGAMLHQTRLAGHEGRLVGIDPNVASLDRARRRADVEWVEGAARDIKWHNEFDLAVMVSHAFQCLLTDEEIHTSLVAIRHALRLTGQFAFETRHPQAHAWTSWDSANPDELVDHRGRTLHVTNRVDEVADDIVTLTEITASPAGEVLRTETARLRFLDEAALNDRLHAAGFEIEAQYGDWDGSAIDQTSREIITRCKPSS